ncbi:MAG: hypothetical protein KKB21_02420 [Nanoarchaeota archaeon]|nr:hypothetical protein [Nanoarchaeota archaeon]MBU4086410.1 hypothetical protein [Nanoarchaeota archaeon]
MTPQERYKTRYGKDASKVSHRPIAEAREVASALENSLEAITDERIRAVIIGMTQNLGAYPSEFRTNVLDGSDLYWQVQRAVSRVSRNGDYESTLKAVMGLFSSDGLVQPVLEEFTNAGLLTLAEEAVNQYSIHTSLHH